MLFATLRHVILYEPIADIIFLHQYRSGSNYDSFELSFCRHSAGCAEREQIYFEKMLCFEQIFTLVYRSICCQTKYRITSVSSDFKQRDCIYRDFRPYAVPNGESSGKKMEILFIRVFIALGNTCLFLFLLRVLYITYVT